MAHNAFMTRHETRLTSFWLFIRAVSQLDMSQNEAVAAIEEVRRMLDQKAAVFIPPCRAAAPAQAASFLGTTQH